MLRSTKHLCLYRSQTTRTRRPDEHSPAVRRPRGANKRIMATIVIPTSGVAEYVAELARKHGIQYVRTADDALAEVITRLADDEIETDETEDLIVALSRAHSQSDAPSA